MPLAPEFHENPATAFSNQEKTAVYRSMSGMGVRLQVARVRVACRGRKRRIAPQHFPYCIDIGKRAVRVAIFIANSQLKRTTYQHSTRLALRFARRDIMFSASTIAEKAIAA